MLMAHRTTANLRLLWVCLIGGSLASSVGCRMSANGNNVDGVRQLQMGNYYGAIDEFRQAMALDPGNADAYYNLAATYHEMGKQTSDRTLLDQAEGLYHQCLDLNPDHVDCHRALAVLLVQTERPESAFTLLQRWTMRSQRTADARIELARLHEEFGDKEAATRYLTEALELDPQSARAWTALGRLREQQGQLAQALSNYQHAYNLNNFQPGVANRIATLQRDLSVQPNGAGSDTKTVRTPGDDVPR